MLYFFSSNPLIKNYCNKNKFDYDMTMIKNILNKGYQTNLLEKEEIITLLKSNDNLLYEIANKIRAENLGDDVHLRGLIEFSNICKQHCKYCGLRCENNLVSRYRLIFNREI